MVLVFSTTTTILSTEFVQHFSNEELPKELYKVSRETGVNFSRSKRSFTIVGNWECMQKAYTLLSDLLEAATSSFRVQAAPDDYDSEGDFVENSSGEEEKIHGPTTAEIDAEIQAAIKRRQQERELETESKVVPSPLVMCGRSKAKLATKDVMDPTKVKEAMKMMAQFSSEEPKIFFDHGNKSIYPHGFGKRQSVGRPRIHEMPELLRDAPEAIKVSDNEEEEHVKEMLPPASELMSDILEKRKAETERNEKDTKEAVIAETGTESETNVTVLNAVSDQPGEENTGVDLTTEEVKVKSEHEDNGYEEMSAGNESDVGIADEYGGETENEDETYKNIDADYVPTASDDSSIGKRTRTKAKLKTRLRLRQRGNKSDDEDMDEEKQESTLKDKKKRKISKRKSKAPKKYVPSEKKIMPDVEIKKEEDEDYVPDEKSGKKMKKKRGRKKKEGADQIKEFACNKCSYVGRRRKNLTEHNRRNHKLDKMCDICGKGFGFNKDLSRHKESVHADPSFFCNICERFYKSKRVYDEHLKTHEAGYVRPSYKCQICVKSFSTKYVLANHIRQEHLGQKKTYLCPTCGKSFSQKNSYIQHANVHAGIKPYVCDICGKSFPYEKSLKEHKFMHDDVRRFQCHICSKTFKQTTSLRIHMKVHQESKDHICPTCGKGFTQKQALLRHERIHSGSKPYTCRLCYKTFNDTSIIRRHMMLVHKKEPKKWREDVVADSGPRSDFFIDSTEKRVHPRSLEAQAEREAQEARTRAALGEDEILEDGKTDDHVDSVGKAEVSDSGPANPLSQPVFPGMLPSASNHEPGEIVSGTSLSSREGAATSVLRSTTESVPSASDVVAAVALANSALTLMDLSTRAPPPPINPESSSSGPAPRSERDYGTNDDSQDMQNIQQPCTVPETRRSPDQSHLYSRVDRTQEMYVPNIATPPVDRPFHYDPQRGYMYNLDQTTGQQGHWSIPPYPPFFVPGAYHTQYQGHQS